VVCTAGFLREDLQSEHPHDHNKKSNASHDDKEESMLYKLLELTMNEFLHRALKEWLIRILIQISDFKKKWTVRKRTVQSHVFNIETCKDHSRVDG
jgi:hypothetical protein